ncbi:NAD(P)-binding domain-containing protein [Paludibacterium denitrificans]|uniref:NAD(P)-binding domain-containing protein n=1 Tax=Paludibacterium denitrificans TaxID=2675226 RepID=UPI0028AC3D13|nr:NAD(P)-binding domain-containing protein [Paludibacterium denitrificans]
MAQDHHHEFTFIGIVIVIKQQLLNRIADKSAVIGIVGLGYVGLPLMLRFAEVGYKVLGFDIDPSKVEALNA